METFFAAPERAGDDELRIDIGNIIQNPFFDGVLHAVSGLVAVLNPYRQVVAINHAFLDMLGIDEPTTVLGLRPGEIIGCIHAHEMEGGCGTSKFCSTCGAAIAIVSSLRDNRSQERYCAATVRRDGTEVELYLRVQAHPIRLDGRTYVLLFLQDVSRLQHWETMERIFFHDINNLLAALSCSSDLLTMMPEKCHELAGKIRQVVGRLRSEVAVQQGITADKLGVFSPGVQEISIPTLVEELQALLRSHPASAGKRFAVHAAEGTEGLQTDYTLLLRVLANMLINAFEASDPDDEIRLTITSERDSVMFSVWNRREIPDDVQKRVFQRNFSTKGDLGRGFGTYAMKLFGEQFLGGLVSFSSGEGEGTTFRLRLPCKQKDGGPVSGDLLPAASPSTCGMESG